MNRRRIEYMCAHCGWIFDALLGGGLVPIHKWEPEPGTSTRCPGSEQNPRNPHSDRRPLWKDLTPEKEEAMRFAAPTRVIDPANGKVVSEAVCVPNGFGLCSTHPICDYMRGSVSEYQAQVEKIKAQWVKETGALHRLIETQEKMIARSDDAVNKLIAYACTCKRRNEPEWMKMFADLLNAAIAAQGSDDSVEWPGKWANEFHLVSGGPAKTAKEST